MPTTNYPLPTTHYQLPTTRSKCGFTLIELLVAIAIIGILASIAIVSYSSAQSKGRDGRRKSDLDALKKSLEIFRSETSSGCCYPLNIYVLPTAPLESLGYIKKIPTDPRTSAVYTYTPTLSDGTSSCSTSGDTPTTASCQKYTMVACLENGADPQKDSALNSACTGKPASYSVTSP